MSNIIVVKCFWCEQMRDLWKYVCNVVLWQRWRQQIAFGFAGEWAGRRQRESVCMRSGGRAERWMANQRKWDGTNMPIDKVPSEQLSFRSKTDYNFMQNLWDLRVRYSLLHTNICIFYTSSAELFVVCGERLISVLDWWIILWSFRSEICVCGRFFLFWRCVVWHHFPWFVWCVSFWQKDETC